MAKLYYRYGAMNSGKTTALLQVAFNYNERGMRVLILKASVDTKGGDHIVSRLGGQPQGGCAGQPRHGHPGYRPGRYRRSWQRPCLCAV